MNENDYLKGIHRKIRFRKIRDNAVGSAGALALCLVIFFFAPAVDGEFLFEELYDSVSYYEWEVIEDPTEREIFDYLIDYTCIEEYDEIMDDSLMEIINNMNLGG